MKKRTCHDDPAGAVPLVGILRSEARCLRCNKRRSTESRVKARVLAACLAVMHMDLRVAGAADADGLAHKAAFEFPLVPYVAVPHSG